MSLLTIATKLAELQNRQLTSEEAAAAAAGCGILGLLFVGYLALTILLLVWTVKDAKARGMDTPVLWLLVVFFLGIIGFVIYLLARPAGLVARCSHCGNKRMTSLAACPHCKRT